MEQVLKRHQALLSQVDDWFIRSMERYPEAISCKSGCSACCRSLFDITLLDAYFLKLGFDQLPEEVRAPVLEKCRQRLEWMRQQWPEFSHPYLLNYRPEEEWDLLMPEEDETLCVLSGDDGRCLAYENRPMTCRLHGIPHIDVSGEVMHDEWCTMNFTDCDPLELQGLAAPFDAMLREEVELFRAFTERLLNRRLSQLDTFIPTALLIDFEDLKRDVAASSGIFDW